MYVNSDWTRPLDFIVKAEPQPWQYDMVLSPVVSSTLRAHDVRVVVSWVGSADFYSGVLNPFLLNPHVEGTSFVHDSNEIDVQRTYLHATGTNYYDFTTLDEFVYKKNGIWYHGFNSTPGQTSAESFTIDTSESGVMLGNLFIYVRSPSPIKNFKTLPN